MKALVIALMSASTNLYAQNLAPASCADLPHEAVATVVNASDATYDRVMRECDRQLGALTWQAESGQAFSKAHAAAVELQDWMQMVARARMKVKTGKTVTADDLLNFAIEANNAQRR